MTIASQGLTCSRVRATDSSGNGVCSNYGPVDEMIRINQSHALCAEPDRLRELVLIDHVPPREKR